MSALFSLLIFAPAQFFPDGGAWDDVAAVRGVLAGEELGRGIATGADVNGDGVDDWAFTRAIEPGPRPDMAAIVIVSGANHDVIVEHDLGFERRYWGHSLEFGEDYNADGVPDLIVGAYEYCAIISGADATLIRELVYNYRHGSEFARTVVPVEDADADGVGDLLVSSPRDNLVILFSGATGDELLTMAGANLEYFGTDVVECADLDGDGRRDWVISAYRGNTPSGTDGYLRFVSSADGSTIRRVDADLDHYFTGLRLFIIDDLDGDGLNDLASVSRDRLGGGLIELRSISTGAILGEIATTVLFEYSFIGVEFAADMDGDGFGEFLWVDDYDRWPGGRLGSLLMVYSLGRSAPIQEIYGRSGESYDQVKVLESPNGPVLLASDFRLNLRYTIRRFEITEGIELSESTYSVSAGGSLGVDLDFPNEARLAPYRILMSWSGQGPVRRGVWIPLSDDSLFRATLAGALPRYPGSMLSGQLDGSAEASLILPVDGFVHPSWVGRTLSIAAVSQGTYLYSTKAATVDIVP